MPNSCSTVCADRVSLSINNQPPNARNSTGGPVAGIPGTRSSQPRLPTTTTTLPSISSVIITDSSPRLPLPTPTSYGWRSCHRASASSVASFGLAKGILQHLATSLPPPQQHHRQPRRPPSSDSLCFCDEGPYKTLITALCLRALSNGMASSWLLAYRRYSTSRCLHQGHRANKSSIVLRSLPVLPPCKISSRATPLRHRLLDHRLEHDLAPDLLAAALAAMPA